MKWGCFANIHSPWKAARRQSFIICMKIYLFIHERFSIHLKINSDMFYTRRLLIKQLHSSENISEWIILFENRTILPFQLYPLVCSKVYYSIVVY